VNDVIGRPEHNPRLHDALQRMKTSRVLITGAHGSIGKVLEPILRHNQIASWPTDIEAMDVTDFDQVKQVVEYFKPTLILHLAADKHAPNGEEDPFTTTMINTYGTQNVLRAAGTKAKLVITSTCKACAPETAYGASKLIAERMVLNAGGGVARLYNVVDTHGNVFRHWEQLDPQEPLPVTNCTRFFISAHEAVGLLLWTAVMPSGRYTIDPGQRLPMSIVANHLYPMRAQVMIPSRRGDRLDEPRWAAHERALTMRSTWPDWIRKIESPHDKLQGGSDSA